MTSMNALKRHSPAAVAMFAMLALTGCAAGADDDPNAGRDPKSGESDSAEPTEEPPPSAADGTDYSNCDTQCEVEVTEGVVIEYEAFTMTIADVSEEGVEITRDDGAGNTGGTTLSSGCLGFLSATGAGLTCYGSGEAELPEPQPAAGEIAIELIYTTDETAIIRLTVG